MTTHGEDLSVGLADDRGGLLDEDTAGDPDPDAGGPEVDGESPCIRTSSGPDDEQSHSELVETLSTWLQTRNVAQASRQMFVHYNTFKNRLERIEAILGPVLNEPGRLLECEVAIHVARHYDGPWTHTPPDR